VHVARGGLLVAGAGAFAALALTAPGRLGALRVCGVRLHAVLDVVVALALAAAPALRSVRPDATGIVVVEVAAVGWIRLSTLTRYRRPQPAAPVAVPTSGRGATAPRAGGATAPRAGGATAPRAGVATVPAALASGARGAGRAAARLHRRWRNAQDGGR